MSSQGHYSLSLPLFLSMLWVKLGIHTWLWCLWGSKLLILCFGVSTVLVVVLYRVCMCCSMQKTAVGVRVLKQQRCHQDWAGKGGWNWDSILLPFACKEGTFITELSLGPRALMFVCFCLKKNPECLNLWTWGLWTIILSLLNLGFCIWKTYPASWCCLRVSACWIIP